MFLYPNFAKFDDVGAAENLNVSVPQLREFRCGDRRNLRISSATIGLKIVRFFSFWECVRCGGLCWAELLRDCEVILRQEVFSQRIWGKIHQQR